MAVGGNVDTLTVVKAKLMAFVSKAETIEGMFDALALSTEVRNSIMSFKTQPVGAGQVDGYGKARAPAPREKAKSSAPVKRGLTKKQFLKAGGMGQATAAAKPGVSGRPEDKGKVKEKKLKKPAEARASAADGVRNEETQNLSMPILVTEHT